jgi:hypothetical protein
VLLIPASLASAQEGGVVEPTPPKASRDDELEDAIERIDALERKVADLSRPKATLKLLDISLDGLFAAGGSTATDEELESLQGGGHDPHKRGFTVQNVELTFAGAVDPYFRGDAAIVATIDPDGETVVELEEAFLTTTSLPWGLQVKGGQFFTEFGRLNASHPHSWDFVDQPVVNTRMFGGDGMRGPGVRASWLAPTGFPLELIGTVQNANGETMTSFLATEDGQVGGRPTAAPSVRSLADMVYTGRLTASFDIGENTVVLPGLSGTAGPNGTGSSARTRILGADLTVKWKPKDADQGFPFFAWQSEAMVRRFQADAYFDPGPPVVSFPHEVLEDRGAYSQVVWGFTRGWTVGGRFDCADGREGDPESDPMRDRRTRGSAALTWFPSEFSKLRLQVNRDDSEALGTSTSVWLQFEFTLGAHGAHKF